MSTGKEDHGSRLFTSSSTTRTEKKRRLKALGLLSRPELDDHQSKLVGRLLNSPEWTPITRISAADLLDQLYLHHLSTIKVSPEKLFGDTSRLDAARNSIPQLGPKYYYRRQLINQALDSLGETGVNRVVLIKGAALEKLYPNPAFRQMCDLDVALRKEDLDAANSAFSKAGWSERRFPNSILWQHPSGLMVDVHWPWKDFDRDVLESAQSHPAFPGSPHVYWPNPAHHLLILSLHSANNCGCRLWRDVCDVQALLSCVERSVASEALELGERYGLAPPLAALFRFLNKYCFPPYELPEKAYGKEDNYLLSLFEQMGAEEASPAALNLLRFTVCTPRFPSMGRSSGDMDEGWRESDPELGLLPERGSWKRHMLKLRVIGSLIRSGKVRHYLRLVRMQQRAFEEINRPFS